MFGGAAGWAILFAACFPGAAQPRPPAADADLERGFRDPPAAARLSAYWWWLNGNTTKEAITRDLEEMKAKGFGGAMIIDAGGAEQRGNDRVPAGPRLGSPAWMELFRQALATADRLGLEIGFNIQSGWNLGGPTVTPEDSAKLVAWERIPVKGPAPFDRPLPVPPHREGFYRDIAVLAYPLRHGAALPGAEPGSRRPIDLLKYKAVFDEFGMSAPETVPLLKDHPAQPGEEDTRAADVLDLSPQMDADGRFRWDVPAGEWEILRFGYTSSGSVVSTSSDTWQGLVIDYLDRRSFETYWRQVVEPILAGGGAQVGRTLKHLVTDSWELRGVNWTPRFRQEFLRRRGYDLLPYLPVFAGRIVESREVTNRFLNDLRRTVSDLIADEHYSVFAALAARHGLGIHPESGGPHGAPIDSLKMLGIGAYPQMEFWARAQTHRIRDDQRFFVKQAASAAHIYGKTLVAAEGETTIGPHWEESIWSNLKPSFDRAVCEGLNQLIWHEVTSSPPEMGKPGQEYFAGTHFNPNVTWWPQSGAFLTYINRIQFLMQQGLFVADALYYYGDLVPNFVRLKAADPAKVLPGYDYDVTNEEVLLTRLSVREGRLVLPDGMSYRLLVLPAEPVVSLAALRTIRDLVAAGATVLGPKPRRTTGLEGFPAGDEEVARIAAELWGPCDGVSVREHRYRQGRIVCAGTGREALGATGVPPDFEGGDLDYIHRRHGDADIYFVSNQHDRVERLDVLFRVRGREPELWFPDTGETRRQAVYDFTADGRTRVPIRLEPYGSVVVLFRRPAGNRLVSVWKDGAPAAGEFTLLPGAGEALTLVTTEPGKYECRDSRGKIRSAVVPPLPAPRPLAGSWTVRFAEEWGAPAAVTFDALRSWTEHGHPGVKYYAGTATYEKDVEVPAGWLGAGKAVTLDLGEFHEVAEVRWNGTDFGVVWNRPFTVDITAAARPGPNKLEIRVTNLWPNRLIGDQHLPAAERRTRTNIRKFTKESPLLPSGLLGPVSLRPKIVASVR